MAGPDLYPLTFESVFRDHIWGGRNLETVFGRMLPPGIVDAHLDRESEAERDKVKGGNLAQLLSS